jgi:hypothetical protein
MSALARWDTFLAQIEGRHRDVRTEAFAAALHAVSQLAAGGDYLPLSHQLSAVDNRLQDLERKIIDTWHEKVDDAICAEAHGEEARTAAREKGIALQYALDDEREELTIRILADLARQRYKIAVAQHRAPPCGACGKPLDAPVSFRALQLPCRCGAATVWQPPELMVSVAGIGTHPMSQEAATKEWRAMRAAERALAAVRPSESGARPLALVKAVERAQIAYWRAYLKARAWFEPELARDPEMEIRRRMKHFYDASPELA